MIRYSLSTIDTAKLSTGYRRKAVDLEAQRILITDFRGSDQSKDFTDSPNCGGFGRVRRFRRRSGSPSWPLNPLPIDPACRALGLEPTDEIRAQVFQNAVCNWRCWYCFVDFDLLSGDRKRSAFLSAAELVDRYLTEADCPCMIDLTGGQPDLTPEWVPWMIRALKNRGVDQRVYLWSDDNLSNDYFWRFLNDDDRAEIATFNMYGRVCCFKGFDETSFAFNTQASSDLFSQQFSLFGRLVELGIDMYGYVTLTSPVANGLRDKIAAFVDRLQAVHPNLPLRIVPLEVRSFTPVRARMTPLTEKAIDIQHEAICYWKEELGRRFSCSELALNITDVQIR